jgi:hypothetical protein
MSDRMDPPPRSFIDVVYFFTQTSTIVGVNRIVSSPFRVQSFVWLVLVCAGLTATVAYILQ